MVTLTNKIDIAPGAICNLLTTITHIMALAMYKHMWGLCPVAIITANNNVNTCQPKETI